MEKYRQLSTGKIAKIVRRVDDNVTYIMDGFVRHACIEWFTLNFKKIEM